MANTAAAATVTFSNDRRRSAACGFLTALVFVTAVVVMRRVSGDAAPLAQLAAALIGLLAIGLSTVCTIVPGVLREPLDLPARLLATGLASTPGLVLGLALLPAGSVPGAATLLCVFCVAVTCGTLCGELPPPSVRQASLLAEARRVLAARPRTDTTPPESSANQVERDLVDLPRPAVSLDETPGISAESMEESLPFDGTTPHPADVPTTTQWMSRGTLDEGESAEGGCRAEFEAGQKLATIHLSFSPAFSVAPELECEPLDDSDVTIKVAAMQAYGVRLEVTRKGDCESPECVPVSWFAFAESAAETAAAA